MSQMMLINFLYSLPRLIAHPSTSNLSWSIVVTDKSREEGQSILHASFLLIKGPSSAVHPTGNKTVGIHNSFINRLILFPLLSHACSMLSLFLQSVSTTSLRRQRTCSLLTGEKPTRSLAIPCFILQSLDSRDRGCNHWAIRGSPATSQGLRDTRTSE
jgi:hypothetical protein